MDYQVSHDREEETLEAKARWFQQKPLKQRLREALEGIVLSNKLRRWEPAHDRSTFTTVRILELPSR